MKFFWTTTLVLLISMPVFAAAIDVESDSFRSIVRQAVACRKFEAAEVVRQLGFSNDGSVIAPYGQQLWAATISPNVRVRTGKCEVRVSSPNRFGGVQVGRCAPGKYWFMLAPMAVDATTKQLEFCSFPTITFKSQWVHDGYDQYGNPINYRETATDFQVVAGSCDSQAKAVLHNHSRATNYTYNLAREAACLNAVDLP